MITASNGTNTISRSFFKYSRPAFTGFGFAEEPDPNVAQAVKELVALLEKGFADQNGSDDNILKNLKDKQKYLEDENQNGTRAANSKLKSAMETVKLTTKKLNQAESKALEISDEVKQARVTLNRLLNKKIPVEVKPDIEKGKKATSDTTSSDDDIKDQINKAREDLEKKETQQKEADNFLLQVKNELVEMNTNKEEADLDLFQISREVEDNLQETIRAIESVKTEGSRNYNYKKILSLNNLPGQEGKRIKFKFKIGADPKLNSPFLIVEDKLKKSGLSFNASLFLKYDVITEYLFLRTFYIDGLRDDQAIFERITDEEEGGVKYLYNYIVTNVVTKIIKAKKLNDE